jgi:tryptophan 2,3-dioxygenase
LNDNWRVAASYIRFSSAILNFLGNHILLLSSMVLRDYLVLKIELQGTSGEGSVSVRSFRAIILSLLDPLVKVLIDLDEAANLTSDLEVPLVHKLINIYSDPSSSAGIYEYCKSLESIESAIIGGFYYKHFLLATNVLGMSAKGTTNKTVMSLKNSVESSIFPVLYSVRVNLGK